MRVFVSSVIDGYESYRAAAVAAIRALGHEAIRAEDFGAAPSSPQQVCLAGVRAADAVVLLLGERYGYIQPSGHSATHEEYREARERCPVLAFVQTGVNRDATMQGFVYEVQSWQGGQYTTNFSTPTELQNAVTRAMHELELARAAGLADEAEMLARAEQVALRTRGSGVPTIAIVVAGGPRQQVLRPAQLEDAQLASDLIHEALFGQPALFDRRIGTQDRVEANTLILAQTEASIVVDDFGTVNICQPALEERRNVVEMRGLIEEHVQDLIIRGLRFAGWMLDRIDPIRRLSDIVVVASLLNGGFSGWRTRAEHAANPHMMQVGRSGDRVTVHLAPARRTRAALSMDTRRIAEDLVGLLRRNFRQ